MMSIFGNRHYFHLAADNPQRGFSLLEVLIGLLVLSFGILGTAKLQLSILKVNQQAQHTSNAIFLSEQIGNQILANLSAKNNYLVFPNNNSLPFTGCKSIHCTDKEIAKMDTSHWQENIANTLPSGTGEINIQATQLNIIVRWDGENSGASGLNCPKKSVDDLDCLTYTVSLLP